MPGNKYNTNSTHIPQTRTGRLLREKELRDRRKSSWAASHSNEVTGNNRGTEFSDHDLRLGEGENSRSYIERFLEEAAAARAQAEGCDRQDVRPYNRQRLLVVANRLPVSAVRRGEDSWSLEISAGGLVSALLGKLPLHPRSFVAIYFFLIIFYNEMFFLCFIMVQLMIQVLFSC